MSKNKSNRKFIIGSSIALLVLFGVSLGATYGITFASMDDPNYIKFYIADKEYDINDLQDIKSTTTREGEDTTTSYSTDADIILSQYYSAALFGTTDYKEFNATATPIDNYLLSGKDDSILTPYVWDEINDGSTSTDLIDPAVASDYKSYFVNMKFISESLNQPVYKYLADLNADGSNQEITDILTGMMNDVYTVGGTTEPFTAWNVLTIHNGGEELYNDIITALMDDTTYQKEIFEEMFIYSYLWQETSDRSYDYFITEAITKSKMSLVSELTIDTDLADPDDIAAFSGATLDDPYVDATDWNTLVGTLDAAGAISSSEVDSYVSDDTFKGFKGVQFNTTDNTSIASNYYDVTNTWDLSSESNVADSDPTTVTGKDAGKFTNEDVLKQANYYVADPREDVNGLGAVISSEDQYGDITGTATVTSYSQLYPYLFAEKVEDGSSSYLKNPHYAMFANENEGKLTEGTKSDHNEYIFDRWFGTGESAGAKDSILGEIYIVESLVANDTSLKTKAYEYWNQKGYYIELSGKAKDNYSSYVPAGLLKKD